MRVLVALGGNALQKRGEPMTVATSGRTSPRRARRWRRWRWSTSSSSHTATARRSVC
jgi:hypothetical protein